MGAVAANLPVADFVVGVAVSLTCAQAGGAGVRETKGEAGVQAKRGEASVRERRSGVSFPVPFAGFALPFSCSSFLSPGVTGVESGIKAEVGVR